MICDLKSDPRSLFNLVQIYFQIHDNRKTISHDCVIEKIHKSIFFSFLMITYWRRSVKFYCVVPRLVGGARDEQAVSDPLQKRGGDTRHLGPIPCSRARAQSQDRGGAFPNPLQSRCRAMVQRANAAWEHGLRVL